MVAHRPRAEVSLFSLARRAGDSVRRRPRRARLLLLVALLVALLPSSLLPAPARAAPGCQITRSGALGGNDLDAAIGYPGCPTITFASGVAEVTVPTYLTIARDVTIQGPGANNLTIRHTGPSAVNGNVFYIKAGTVTLRGLTVAGGRSTSSWGAGLSIAGAPNPVNVTLDGVTVTDNIATNAGGGGIYASNATLNLIDSTISANQSGGSGDVRYGGGGIYLEDVFGRVQATLTRTSIVANQAPSNRGGGILISVHPPGNTVILALNDSTLASNHADGGGGGGLFSDHGTVSLNNTIVSGNVAKQAGGLANSSGTITLNGSTIRDNTAVDYEGGGLLNEGIGATMTVLNSTISGNTAGQIGGGLHNFRGTVALTNSTISGNMAATDGGGLYAYQGVTTLRFVTVIGNVADAENNGTGTGGGIARTDIGSLTVLSSIIAGNRKGPNAPNDCSGTLTSVGRNLWGDQTACPNNAVGGDQNLFALNLALAAVLDPTLADNGGPTKTHNLVASGPAVNKGDNVTCATALPDGPGGRDQRNVPRTDGKCDVGAVEYTAAPPSPSPSASPSPTPSTGPAPSFADVPTGYWAHEQIISFARRGITTGCGDNDRGQRLYCPERGVTRAEMAAFLDRAKKQTELANPTPTFADVPPSYWAYGWIERFFTLGVTTGCGTDDGGNKVYCPDRGVTRAEMAVFIIRAYP